MTQLNGGGVRDGNEEDGNEKLWVKHGGVISVLVVRPTSSRGIRPRFHIPGIGTALACAIQLPMHGRVGPGGHQTTMENWVEASSVARVSRNWTMKLAFTLECRAYFTVHRVLLPAGRRDSTSHLFRDRGRCGDKTGNGRVPFFDFAHHYQPT